MAEETYRAAVERWPAAQITLRQGARVVYENGQRPPIRECKAPPGPCGILRMTDMRCPGCGAEMHLIDVAPDKTKMVPGYEQRTFECSGCHDHVRQLVFTPRAIEPLNSEEMQLSAAWLENLNKGSIVM